MYILLAVLCEQKNWGWTGANWYTTDTSCGNWGFVPSINLVWHCSIAPLNSKRRAQPQIFRRFGLETNHLKNMFGSFWISLCSSEYTRLLRILHDHCRLIRRGLIRFGAGRTKRWFSSLAPTVSERWIHRSHRWQGHWGCRKMPNPMTIRTYPLLQALKYVDESFYRERDFMVEAVAIAGRWRPILLGYRGTLKSNMASWKIPSFDDFPMYLDVHLLYFGDFPAMLITVPILEATIATSEVFEAVWEKPWQHPWTRESQKTWQDRFITTEQRPPGTL